MSTSVTFTNSLTAEPKLLHSCQGQPFAGYDATSGRRLEAEPGERGDLELTRQSAAISTVVNDSAEPVPWNLSLCNLAHRDGKTGKVEQRLPVVSTVTTEN
jgi:hypothetical protein